MNRDTYFNNGNCPPGFEDEGIVVAYQGLAIGSLNRVCKESRKQKALDMIYGSTPFDNDTYALKYNRMSFIERALEDKRVNDILKEYE